MSIQWTEKLVFFPYVPYQMLQVPMDTNPPNYLYAEENKESSHQLIC